jgi:hypothetical protein
MNLIVGILVYFVFFGSIGMLIGQRKGRAFAGFVWAMLLGPLGWLLVILGPDMNAVKSTKCPHCGGVLPLNQGKCNHCENQIRWIQGRAFRPPRIAE